MPTGPSADMVGIWPTRGSIVLVDFGSPRPADVAYVRPAIVVSNDRVNEYAAALVVVPLSSNLDEVHAFQVLLPHSRTGLDRDSKAQVELLRHVGRARVRRALGQVPADLMKQVDIRLTEHLGLAGHA